MTIPTGIELLETAEAVADAGPTRRLAGAIGDVLHARCVILFGSRARGDHRVSSDVDIAIVAKQAELNARERHDLRQQALAVAESVADGQFPHVDVIVWTEEEFRAKKRSINHVAGRAWREGKILYGLHETLPGEEVVSELDNARELMRMCRKQIQGVNNMMDETVFSEELFGFHAQRGTELALKAWVSLVGQRYERTHSVADLLVILNDAGVIDVQRYAHLATLTPYAVKYVYKEIENPTMDRQYIAEEVNALGDLVESRIWQAEEDDASD